MTDSAAGTRRALILFAHGSRDAEWVRPFEALRQTVSASHTGVSIALAYLESTNPDLSTCIRALADENVNDIRVLPLFLALGKHLRSDIPALASKVADEFPGLRIEFLPALGETPELADALLKIAMRAVS